MRAVFNTLMMHWLARFLVLTGSCLALGLAAEEGRAVAYRKALLDCQLFASQAEIHAALKVLNADDAEVIFELAGYLECETLASESFQEARMERDPKTGEYVLHKPTIGDVAMMLIQWKIEAPMRGGYQPVRILGWGNVKEWIDARRHLTLREMQWDAAKEGVEKAGEAFRANHDNHSLKTLNHFRESLHSILMLGKPPQGSSLLQE